MQYEIANQSSVSLPVCPVIFPYNLVLQTNEPFEISRDPCFQPNILGPLLFEICCSYSWNSCDHCSQDNGLTSVYKGLNCVLPSNSVPRVPSYSSLPVGWKLCNAWWLRIVSSGFVLESFLAGNFSCSAAMN